MTDIKPRDEVRVFDTNGKPRLIVTAKPASLLAAEEAGA